VVQLAQGHLEVKGMLRSGYRIYRSLTGDGRRLGLLLELGLLDALHAVRHDGRS
jgi:hypothetical protein